MEDDTRTDFELLDAWTAGDRCAGSTLVGRHFDALYRFFENKARGHEDDLIQQTLMASVVAKDGFRRETSFRAFLFGLARNHLLTHYRRWYRRGEVEFETTSIRDLAASPSSLVARREAASLLDCALQSIPADQQIALELAYWQGLTAREIAFVLEVPENTVYSRLSRAKAHLREALARLTEDASHRAGALELLQGEGARDG